MSKMAIAWLMAYAAGALLAFIHPIYGLFAYFLDYYAHPPLRWWGDALPELRWSLLIALVTFAAFLLKQGSLPELKVTRHPQTKWLILFVLNAIIVTMTSAVDQEASWERVMDLGKYLILYHLIVQTVRTEAHFHYVLFIHVLGIFHWGWNAYETPNRSAGRLGRLGGPDSLKDNKTASHLLSILPFIGVVFSTGSRWQKVICVLAAPFVVNAFILLNSRGGFVGLLFTGAVALVLLRGTLRWQILFAMITVGLLFVFLVDTTFVERQLTILSYEDDGSSTSRLESWKGGLRLMRDHPFGTGGGGYDFLSPIYIPEIVEAHKGELRTAHNTFILAVTEWGVQGLFFFMAFILSTLRDLYRMHKKTLMTPEGHRMLLQGIGITLGLFGLLSSGFFVNRLYGEAFYWLPAFAAVLSNLHRQEIEAEEAQEDVRAQIGEAAMEVVRI